MATIDHRRKISFNQSITELLLAVIDFRNGKISADDFASIVLHEADNIISFQEVLKKHGMDLPAYLCHETDMLN